MLALKRSGMRDQEVAQAANVTAAWISAVKNDRIKKAPALDKLVAVARVLHIPARELTEPLGIVPVDEAAVDAILDGLSDQDRRMVRELAMRLRGAAPNAPDVGEEDDGPHPRSAVGS